MYLKENATCEKDDLTNVLSLNGILLEARRFILKKYIFFCKKQETSFFKRRRRPLAVK